MLIYLFEIFQGEDSQISLRGIHLKILRTIYYNDSNGFYRLGIKLNMIREQE